MKPKSYASDDRLISRRDFLKFSSICLFGWALNIPETIAALSHNTSAQAGAPENGFLFDTNLALRQINKLPVLPPGQQARVLESSINVYNSPSFSASLVKIYWKDDVLPITNVTLGDDKPAHNRIWYRVGEEGYAHSGTLQPVRTIINSPVTEIPEGGILAEVTVPYTDAHWKPGKEHEVAYRCYYATTYWVIGLVYDSIGMPWYRILEDKWEFLFYAPAQHLRILTPDELTPLSPHVSLDAKRLEVRTEDQIVVAYEKERMVFVTRTATGAKFSNGDFSTPAGRHITYHKRPSRHMAAGNLALN